MWQLYQFPLCPFSRKVRLTLAEKGIAFELKRVSPWERTDEFLDMNPAGQTPVLVEDARSITLIDSRAICDYIEETVDAQPMIPGTALDRAEIRRLVAWMDEQLFGDLVAPLLEERMRKRLARREAPDTRVLRDAMKAGNAHLDYLDYLIDTRRWLAGPVLTLADLAAAAHLSVADYLGGVDWRGHQQTVAWYGVRKSRPSFRPVLAERMEGILPPPHYAEPDF
jgi:glutathione S-transferase